LETKGPASRFQPSSSARTKALRPAEYLLMQPGLYRRAAPVIRAGAVSDARGARVMKPAVMATRPAGARRHP
jgi:hypothetical protein